MLLIVQGYNEIRIDMELNGVKWFAQYSNFSVDGEILNYKLTVSGFSGSAGDSFTQHSGTMFTTSDRDHDKDYHDCAVVHTSAWWYDTCSVLSDLNGIWDVGVIWHGIDVSLVFKSLSLTEMKVRRN
jgi:ficolin